MEIQHLQKRLPLIIAIACGILAIILLNIYLQGRESQLLTQVNQTVQQGAGAGGNQPQQKLEVVLIAQKDIPEQTPITPGDLAIKEVPKEYIQPGAITSLDQVIGQISSGMIAAGEQILKTKIRPPGKTGKTLSEITPEGKRAVTISVDNISSIAGLIRPGDHVDVSALVTPPASAGAQPGFTNVAPRILPLFQDVEVLAVGSEFAHSERKESTPQERRAEGETITLALGPQEAVLLSFVQEHGKIKLVLRSAQDTKKEPINPADWDVVFQYLYPSSHKEVSTGDEQLPTVEIYRGLHRETMPLKEK